MGLLDSDTANVGIVNIAISLSGCPIWGSVTAVIFMLYYKLKWCVMKNLDPHKMVRNKYVKYSDPPGTNISGGSWNIWTACEIFGPPVNVAT